MVDRALECTDTLRVENPITPMNRVGHDARWRPYSQNSRWMWRRWETVVWRFPTSELWKLALKIIAGVGGQLRGIGDLGRLSPSNRAVRVKGRLHSGSRGSGLGQNLPRRRRKRTMEARRARALGLHSLSRFCKKTNEQHDITPISVCLFGLR